MVRWNFRVVIIAFASVVGASRRQRKRPPKADKFYSGAIIPFRSNLFYQKLLKIGRPTPRLRSRHSAACKTEKCLFFFEKNLGGRLKKWSTFFCFTFPCFSELRSRSHPYRAFGAEADGQKFISPTPPFLFARLHKRPLCGRILGCFFIFGDGRGFK